MGFRFSLRWCSTGGGPHGRCPPSWAGTRFFFGAAPLQEQVVRLGSSLLPMGGPTRPTPGVPFVSRRKEPKACRGCAPGPPLGGIIIPPAARACMRLLLPPERVCATNPDRFATLSLWANRSFFSLRLAGVTPSAIKPWRGSAGRLVGSCNESNESTELS